MKRQIKLISKSVMFVLFLPTFAFAYIDPGTGSLILQGMAAAVISVAAFWGRIRTFLHNLLTKKDQPK